MFYGIPLTRALLSASGLGGSAVVMSCSQLRDFLQREARRTWWALLHPLAKSFLIRGACRGIALLGEGVTRLEEVWVCRMLSWGRHVQIAQSPSFLQGFRKCVQFDLGLEKVHKGGVVPSRRPLAGGDRISATCTWHRWLQMTKQYTAKTQKC